MSIVKLIVAVALLLAVQCLNISSQTSPEIERLTAKTVATPNDDNVYVQRGNIYLYLNKLAEALADAEKALTIDPTNAHALLLRGKVKNSRKDFDNAIADFTKIIEIDEKNAEAYLARAQAKHGKGIKFSRILDDDFNKVYLINPNHPSLFAVAGTFCLEDGEDGCTGYLKKAIENNSPAVSSPESNVIARDLRRKFALAAISLTKGGFEFKSNHSRNDGIRREAVAYLQIDAAAGKTDADIYRMLGKLFEDSRDYLPAEENYSKAIATRPKDYALYIARADFYRARNANEKAVADFTRAIAIKPADATAFRHRGIAFENMGDAAKAIADYNKAAALAPLDGLTLMHRGNFYFEQKDLAKALADLNRAVELKAADPCVNLYRGRIYLEKNDFTNANADLEVEEIKCALTDFYRGELFFKQGDYGSAISKYDRAWIEYDARDFDKTSIAAALGKAKDAEQKRQGENTLIIAPAFPVAEAQSPRPPPIGSLKCVSGNCSKGYGKFVFPSGSVYEGNIVNGNGEGKGKFTSIDGDIYEGDFVKGKREGQGIYKFKSGDVYIGQFANNRRNGKGKITHTNGNIYEGDFVNENKEGQGTYSFKSGQIYIGEWRNDKYNGRGKLTRTNGEIYDGEWVDNKKTGRGKVTFANGDTYEGNLIDGKFEGQGIYTTKNGDYYTGEWKNNKRNGDGKEYSKATNTSREGLWKDDVLNGAANSKPGLSTATNSGTTTSHPAVSETKTVLRDTLNGKLNFVDRKPLVYKLKNEFTGDVSYYKIEFINDAGKLAFKWNEITKNASSPKLVITDAAIASARKYVNILYTKTEIMPDNGIFFILSQALYQELNTKKEMNLDLGDGPIRISLDYKANAITGIYSNKNLKMLYLHGDDGDTTMSVLDDPMLPLIVEVETLDYKLELVTAPPPPTTPTTTTSKSEAEWKKVCDPFVTKIEAAVDSKKDDAAKQVYADFDAATKEAGTSTSVRNTRKALLKTMHRSNSYPLMKFVREKLKTLNYTEEETKDILSPKLFYV